MSRRAVRGCKNYIIQKKRRSKGVEIPLLRRYCAAPVFLCVRSDLPAVVMHFEPQDGEEYAEHYGEYPYEP